MLKRLNGSWYLTDGILTPVRLDAPACVGDALRGAGILTDGESAADLLKNEWIYRREWRYSLSPEGGFPADGRAYLSLFGLRGEWTALLDGRELARGDDTEAEIALPAGEPGATLTIAFAVPAAAPLWPRVGLDGGCLLRTVGSAAITSLSLNVPDDAPWTARTAVRAEAAGACDLRYVLEIGGERTETIVRETLAPGENLFEHTIHEPARSAACASSAAPSERAATFASGAASPERAAAFASGADFPERAATFAPDAVSPERAAAFASGTASPERAATFVSGAASPERAAAFASGATSPERAAGAGASPRAATDNDRAAAFASGAAPSERAATGASGAASPERAATFAPDAASPERAATFAPDAASPERAAAFASGADFPERAATFASGAPSPERAATFASGAPSPERAAGAGASPRAATDNDRAATFASGAAPSERAAACASGAALSERAAASSSGAASPERAGTPASSVAAANSSVRTMSETKTSTGRVFFARILHKNERSAATANPSARSTPENDRAAVLASGANFLERFSTGADSAARAASPVPGAASSGRFSTDADSPARGAANSDSAARTTTENRYAATFAPGADSSTSGAMNSDSAARAATPASGENFLEHFSADADSAARVNSVDSAAYPANRTSNENFLEHFSTDADSAARVNGVDSAARAANPTSNENFLERFSADADFSDYAAADNGRAAAFASGATSSERAAASTDSAARAATPASGKNFLERFSADADFSDYAAADNGRAAADTGFSARAATDNGRAAAFASGATFSERTAASTDSAARAATPASGKNFLERFSADADFSDYAAADNGRAAADTGFSARAATDNGRAAAFASGAASSERTAANAGFSARAATDNGRAAAFVNGATFSERAAVLANGADSATRAAVTVSLRAEILSGGVVSDSRDARLYIPADETAPRGFAGADAVSAALAAEIGANALCAPDASRARMAAAEHELAFIPYHSLAIQRAARACQRYEALLRLAGDESRVLDPALWRLTGCDMDAPELSSLLSSDGDFEEVCRRSRYRQAIALRDAAEHARMKRVPFLLDGAKDDAPTCLSGSLFDLDGAARPAYFALADAWKAEHAFVLPPESFPADGIVSVPVFYLSDEKMPPCTVNVRAYSMDGQELITAGFPVPGRATDVIGRLCVEMPEDGLLLLRASVLRDGACVSRSDRLITLNEACLSALRPVQLLPDAATLRNASNTVAVGVSVPAAHYFGALLPGETLPLDEPRLTGFETLNPLL